ncbi:hypothetical protein BJY04DRAFT_208474 [Aspergillus karnatakaensis]|uniref:uncharacterized protein n=1 Tax=Aspergillus karnatakaensis TaxID=1810916 RepID=UPI003CCE0282
MGRPCLGEGLCILRGAFGVCPISPGTQPPVKHQQELVAQTLGLPLQNECIVAIHGLNPKNKERHAERTWEVDGKIWLRDFLPKQLPQARIMLFGYNSSVTVRSSAAGVREQAQNLLSKLWLDRQNDENRPLIFVAHSLGGIIVKEALVQAKLGSTYSSIQLATYGIAFFGTPHRGSQLAKLGETMAKAVRAILRTPNNTFINALKENDLYANELSANFQQLLEDYKYINFYETLPLRSLGLIVEKQSAIFGLPDSREITVALAGDHETICRYPSEDDDNYKHVSGLIIKLAAIAMNDCDEGSLFGYSSKGSILVGEDYEPKVCKYKGMIPFAQNPGFVDRFESMDQLKEKTFSLGTTPRIALFGLGGVGKSQIAIELAHQVWTESRASVFWVSASSIDRFREGYGTIFDEYIDPKSDAKCDKLARVKEWFEKKRTDWVLIIDNADETSLFEPKKPGKQADQSQSVLEFLPESHHGTILVTTRNRAAGLKFTKGAANALIEVKTMTNVESKRLIQNSMTDHVLEEREIDELSALLGHLPLAIVQAAAFMQENSMGVETSMDLLCEPFETLGRDTGVPNAIKERDPKAIEILYLVAFLDRNEVPKSLIQHKIKRPLDLAKALGTLKAFSLIVPTAGKGNFSFHRLVQLVLRKWLILENQFEERSIQAMELLDEVYPDATFENWGTCAAYLPHAQSVLSLISNPEGESRRKRIHLQEGIAYYFWSQGRSEEAERLDTQLVEDKKQEFGPEHPETLESIAGLAATYYDQARWTRKKILGLRDRLTLTSMSNLATTRLRLEVLEIAKSEFGEQDEQTITAMANLGPLYLDTGKLDEATLLTQHVLRFRMANSSILSEIYKAQGKLEDAEKLALQTWKAREISLGKKHPETYASMTKFNEAEALLLRMIEGSEQQNSLDYDVLNRKLRLADVYVKQGHEQKAEEQQREALNASIKSLGPDHAFTLKCLYFIAITHKRQNRDSEAIQLMAQVTHREEKILGAFHDDTLQSMHMLTEWCGDDVGIEKLLEIEAKEERPTIGNEWILV